VVFTVLSLVFLALGVRYNPAVLAWVTPPPFYTTEYGYTHFEIPRFINMEVPDIVYANYTLGGIYFVEGQPLLLRIYLTVDLNVEYRILAIDVQPDNAFQMFILNGRTYPAIFPTPSDIYLEPHNDSKGGQIWSGSSTIEFAAPGRFGATVNLFLVPSNPFLEYLNRMHIVVQNNMHFHNETATISIEPSGQAEQFIYENQNLSLTFFILFFASLDIAVTLHEHSYKRVKAREYAAS
jgi:hypothetical protein